VPATFQGFEFFLVGLGRRAKITSHFETAELIGVWFDSVVPGRQEIVWMKI